MAYVKSRFAYCMLVIYVIEAGVKNTVCADAFLAYSVQLAGSAIEERGVKNCE